MKYGKFIGVFIHFMEEADKTYWVVKPIEAQPEIVTSDEYRVMGVQKELIFCILSSDSWVKS